MTPLFQKPTPLVAFVGAGASALPPSNLPTWTGFNTQLLECLCERINVYSGNRQPTAAMLAAFRARRDQTNYFSPDFQAQLMEEEIGADYFRVWESLQNAPHGPVHASLAELAVQGRLAAIITTNFDRLIETALQERGCPFTVFHDQETFTALASQGGVTPAVLPLIKIHGSIEDVSSLVDTLRQRVVGRPKSLNAVLQTLLEQHPWLYLGFSGADFSYDPHYLGILDAATSAKGFVFVTRPGTKIQEGVQSLVAAYGPEKAAIIPGDLVPWLRQTFDLGDSPLASTPAVSATPGTSSQVKQHIERWVDNLGPLAVVNILYALLKSTGLEAEAHWLLRRTWKSYRSPADTRGTSYGRYNYNYGLALLDAGLIQNPISLAEDHRNLLAWKEHADQNAFEFFARSYQSGHLLVAGGQLAGLLAYRGDFEQAVALTVKVTAEARAQHARSAECDLSIACVPLYDLLHLSEPMIQQLETGVTIARELGDEPRRALLHAHLGRFLTYVGRFEAADEALAEAERIGRRLDLRSVLLVSQAARGRWLVDSSTSDADAIHKLRSVVDTIHASHEAPLLAKIDLLAPDGQPTGLKARSPLLCRVLLDLNRAARFAGDGAVMQATLDELDELATEVFPGYCAPYYLSYAECLLDHGREENRTRIAELIDLARRVGLESKNPWVAQAADRLAAQAGHGN